MLLDCRDAEIRWRDSKRVVRSCAVMCGVVRPDRLDFVCPRTYMDPSGSYSTELPM